MQRKKLFIVDGNSYGYRAYYALGGLSTSSGRPTGAVYGFINMLNKLRQEARPDFFTVCFDAKGPTFRHERFDQYKIHRKPMPEDLREQMQEIRQVVDLYGIRRFEMPGYEADDLIASISERLKKEVDVFIVTSDKDMLQLVDEYVKIYNPQKEEAVIDTDRIIADYKVKPGQISDLLALTGDTSDNIPGVPGIGPKTAAELINRFGSLEQILENLESIEQPRWKKLLEEYFEQARLSKELTCIVRDIPLDLSLKQLRPAEPDRKRLKELFRELEFRNLLKDLIQEEPKTASLFKESVLESELLEEFKESTQTAGSVSLQSFAAPENPQTLKKIMFGQDGERLFILPDYAIAEARVKEEIKRVLTDPSLLKIGYDLKTDQVLLESEGLRLAEPFFDIKVAAYLIEPHSGSRSPDEIGFACLGRGVDFECLAGEFFLIREKLETQLVEQNLMELFSRVEMPLIRVLAAMETFGIKINRKFLEDTGRQLDRDLETLTRAIYEQSGHEFNINSPKQLSEVLFNELNLPVLKRGKSGPSTNVEVLVKLAQQHELPRLMLEYRELTKLKTTYVDGLLALADPETDRIHTSFNQTVTATGRLSSSEPNLQNIPIRTETGRLIRQAFIPSEPGWLLVCADYSQIELRVLAHLSEDENLITAFQQDKDIHSFTASLIFNVSQDKVTRKMRNLAKRVNFGIVYGMGAFGLARDIGVSSKEAAKFIAEYFDRYPGVKSYMDGQIEDARRLGYVTTLMNRRRYVPQLTARDPVQRSFAERVAMNMPIQGTAADMIKAAMVTVFARLEREKMRSRLLLQVHDELVFDVPPEEVKRLEQLARQTMEAVLKLKVPVRVNIKSGPDWNRLKEVRK